MINKLVLTVILLATVGGCNFEPPDGTVGPSNVPYNIRYIEGCQYIEVDSGFGHSRVYSLTHKGNCNNPLHTHTVMPEAHQ